MERTLCPICKERHYAREPHIFKNIFKTAVVSNARPASRQLKAMKLPGFDKVGYQRKYMRYWRSLATSIRNGKAEGWPRGTDPFKKAPAS